MENTNENIDSQNDEQIETAETNEVQLTVDDYNALKEKADKLEDTNKKLYARLKKTDSKPLAQAKPQAETQSPEFSTELTKLRLKVDHGISDPDAIDFLLKNGGEEALKNPYIKATMDTMIEQKRAEQAAVEEESSKSETQRKYSTEALKSMSIEELEKNLPHA